MTTLPINKMNIIPLNKNNQMLFDFTNTNYCKKLFTTLLSGKLDGKAVYALIDQLIIEASKGKFGPIALGMLKEITGSVSKGVMSIDVLYNYCNNSYNRKVAKMPDFILWGLMNPPLNTEKDICQSVYKHLQNSQPERLQSIQVNYGPINQGIPIELYTGVFHLDQDIVCLLKGNMTDKAAGNLYRSVLKDSKGSGGPKTIWAQNVLAEIARRIKVDDDPFLKRLIANVKVN